MASEKQSVLIGAITALASCNAISIVAACKLVGVAKSTYYRITHDYQHYQPVAEPIHQRDRHQPAALIAVEHRTIIDILEREDNEDLCIVQIYWRAIDANEIACSQRTFYRIAERLNMVGDRRRGKHGNPGTQTRPAPCALATRPNELWSWDITELAGPTNADRYKLYLIMDVFSRYPVGWRIEHTENRSDAIDMFTTAINTHATPTIVHSDNGAVMRSHDLNDSLIEHGVTTSFSRPRVSDDNPFSESLFKTLKYNLSCPTQFDDIDHARAWTTQFLHDYATHHRHSGLNYYTPEQAYTGTAAAVQERRQQNLIDYYNEHPERFSKEPHTTALPTHTGINIKPDEPQPKPPLSQAA